MSKTVDNQDRQDDEQPVDIEAIAQRFKNGDAVAFDELVGACQSKVFNIAYRMVNSYEDASELTQDVFVKVHKSISKFRGTSKFTTWLYAVAANTCRNRLRKTRKIAFYESQSLDLPAAPDSAETRKDRVVSDHGANPSQDLSQRDTTTAIERCIPALPPDYAAAIVMKDIQGLAYQEVAEALNCSLGTLKSRLFRGRRILREKLQLLGITPGAKAIS